MNLFWYLVVFQKIKNSTILEKPFVKRKTFQVLLEDNFVFVLKIIAIILDLETLELESIFLFWSVCLPLEVLLFEFLEKSVHFGFQIMNKACSYPFIFSLIQNSNKTLIKFDFSHLLEKPTKYWYKCRCQNVTQSHFA